MRIAGIGSRELSGEQLAVCYTLGQWSTKCGHRVISGNAEGADYAFASGANTVDPTKVSLMLPWMRFNAGQVQPGNVVVAVEDLDPTEYHFYLRIAREHHPRFDRLTQGAQKLHLRNGMILFPPAGNHPAPVDLVLAWPSQKPGGGGTGQGMRIAERLGVRLIDLSKTSREELRALCEELRG